MMPLNTGGLIVADAHQFALYCALLPVVTPGAVYVITDPVIFHRITRVLRLTVGDELTLFSRQQIAHVRLSMIGKKDCSVLLLAIAQTQPIMPAITVQLGMLKRESFEEALYSCVELGVNTVQPVITQKMHKNWWSAKERERFERIMIAAAEQSKNFYLPELCMPITLAQLFESPQDNPIFFDATGAPLRSVLEHINPGPDITLFIGPEGDLSAVEKETVRAHGYTVCALTPTILRAQQALVVAVGALRSFLPAHTL